MRMIKGIGSSYILDAEEYVRREGVKVMSRGTTRYDAGPYMVQILGTKHFRPVKLDAKRIERYEEYSYRETRGYLRAITSSTYWKPLASIWNKLYPSTNDVEVNSAYGRIFKDGQWHSMIKLLNKDPGSTRAGVLFNAGIGLNAGRDVLDQPCSLSFTAHVVRDRIESVYSMRSTDVMFGFPHDIVWAMNLSALVASTIIGGHYSHYKYRLTFITSSLHSYNALPKISTDLGLALPYFCRGPYESELAFLDSGV